jgi:hypothetical protein
MIVVDLLDDKNVIAQKADASCETLSHPDIFLPLPAIFLRQKADRKT